MAPRPTHPAHAQGGLPVPRLGASPAGASGRNSSRGHADHYSIYEQSLPGYDPDATPSLAFFGRHVSSQTTNWSDISMCDAQWFEVDRGLAVVVVSDMRDYPKFRDFCQPVCYVAEHYLPTMWYIEFEEKAAMRSVTAVDCSRGGAHRGEFGRRHAREFYKRIRSGCDCVYNGEPGHICYLFARKFLPDSLQPLLMHSNLRRMV